MPPPSVRAVPAPAPGEEPREASPRARPAHRPGRAALAAGYLRRSTDRQEQSIPDQRAAIERFAREEGLSIDHWYIDDAVSGTKASTRPGFMRMIHDAQQRRPAPFECVLVYDVKRFGRLDNDEAGYYRHLLAAAGVEVRYVSEGFAGDDTDDLLRPVKQWQARQESKDLSKVTIRGLLSRAGHGWWMGGAPPHGYDLRYENDRGEALFIVRFMPDASKQILDEHGAMVRTLARGESIGITKRDRARLTPSAAERVETVRAIFRLCVEERRGLTAIADHLNRLNAPTPRGPAWARIYTGKWSDGTVRAILVNPVYRGDMAWNRRCDGRFHRIEDGRAVERKNPHGARLVPNDPGDWIVVRDAHEALVSRRTWELAQSIRASRAASTDGPARPEGGWSGLRSRFVLSGLMTCARCGGRYQGVTRRKGKPRRDGTFVKTRSYACGGYIARGRSVCAFGAVDQERFERLVCETALRHYRRYLGPDGRRELERAALERSEAESTEIGEARAWTASEHRRVEQTIRTLLDAITPATRDLVEERLIELRRERDRLASRSEELERLTAEQSAVRDRVRELGEYFAGLEWTLTQGVPEHRKAALRRCVERIVVDHAKGEAVIAIRALPDDGTEGVQAEEVPVTLPKADHRPRSARGEARGDNG